MIRAVIDTNVLVSGLISRNGNEALVILAVRHSLVTPCVSDAVIAEYLAVLARPKFSISKAELNAVMAMFRDKAVFLTPGYFQAVSPDPADTKFLHCALAAQADFIVTGNKRDFPDGPYGATKIVAAGELLDVITSKI